MQQHASKHNLIDNCHIFTSCIFATKKYPNVTVTALIVNVLLCNFEIVFPIGVFYQELFSMAVSVMLVQKLMYNMYANEAFGLS